MIPRTTRPTRRDAVHLVAVAAAAAFSVSLGVHGAVAIEAVVLMAVLLGVRILLRASPPRDRRPPPEHPDDALTAARRSIEAATAGSLGAQGGFRRVLRSSVAAHLARSGRSLDEVRPALPPDVAALLDGDWPHERGLTLTEVDEALTAVEELP